jgi:hypothetical protein
MPTRRMAAFRLPTQALADLDRLAAALQARSHAGRVSQSDAIAFALAGAVAELDEADERARQAEAKAQQPTPWEPRDTQLGYDWSKPPVTGTMVKSGEEPPPTRVVRVTMVKSDEEPPPTQVVVARYKTEGE